MKTMEETLREAKSAKTVAATLSSERKNQALSAMADALISDTPRILAANQADVSASRLSPSMTDRLTLTEKRIAEMSEGIRAVAKLPDPVGRVLEKSLRPNGLKIEKVSVPMGVVAVIYESRPNVTSDAAALCLKSGNACVLRGGKEAFSTSFEIVKSLRRALSSAGLPEALVSMSEDTSREGAGALMRARGFVDLLIPRGGAGLIRSCVENATVPCIQTGTGICHIYVDKSADFQMALDIIDNAKTSRPSVCNAAEVCLVNKNIAPTFLPLLKERLTDERRKRGQTPVELRLDERAAKYISGTRAGAEDFDTEFLDYILAVGVTDDVYSAAEHISAHSTGHSEAIVASDEEAQSAFLSLVDSAAVYVNASTRFTDGGEFGLGCEMGISTQKLHARGPMGLKELTSWKYEIRGNGQIR